MELLVETVYFTTPNGLGYQTKKFYPVEFLEDKPTHPWLDPKHEFNFGDKGFLHSISGHLTLHGGDLRDDATIITKEDYDQGLLDQEARLQAATEAHLLELETAASTAAIGVAKVDAGIIESVKQTTTKKKKGK